MRSLQKLQSALIYICLLFATFFCLYQILPYNDRPNRAVRVEVEWIATSHSWLDRTACRWLSICGGTNWLGQTHLFYRKPVGSNDAGAFKPQDRLDAWNSERAAPHNWSEQECNLRTIPEYILEYAPYVYLHPKEPYWPSDPAEHLLHMDTMYQHKIQNQDLSLANLSDLNHPHESGSFFLSSRDDPESLPAWIISGYGRPNPYSTGDKLHVAKGQEEKGQTVSEEAKEKGWFEVNTHYSLSTVQSFKCWGFSQSASSPDDVQSDHLNKENYFAGQMTQQSQNASGYSVAPAILITINKSNNVTDAFWFFFNSFNQGNKVFGIRFGNHVGDWEHSMVRFQNGAPRAVFTSRHSFGDAAYSYEAMEKIGRRPVIYAARGSHAMYTSAGTQPYILPFKLLYDTTARGPIWDPILNFKSYTYDLASDTLRASVLNPKAPTSWFHFAGHWGDRLYDLGDWRQYRFFNEYHYSSGPLGPKWKNLQRKQVCESERRKCNIKGWI